jgi:hypothetical protein
VCDESPAVERDRRRNRRVKLGTHHLIEHEYESRLRWQLERRDHPVENVVSGQTNYFEEASSIS